MASPTFDKVFAASQMLHRHGVPFNALCVVNRLNGKKPLDVYRFLKNEVRPRQMQFIPCVEPKVFHQIAPQKWDPSHVADAGFARGTSRTSGFCGDRLVDRSG